MVKATNNLSAGDKTALIGKLKARFEKNMQRHKGLNWADVEAKLLKNTGKLWSLAGMEDTGGEPDVVVLNKKEKAIVFADCSPESPQGRRSWCYDKKALDARKENKPKNSVVEAAAEMGITLMNEEQYRALQLLGAFDTKTSSWILTPPEIRNLGGALFCDRRYNSVFTYHNGAESYYAARGFRGIVQI